MAKKRIFSGIFGALLAIALGIPSVHASDSSRQERERTFSAVQWAVEIVKAGLERFGFEKDSSQPAIVQYETGASTDTASSDGLVSNIPRAIDAPPRRMPLVLDPDG